ncbi:MAG: hypothetical protein FWK01_09170 [Pantanalinema sp. GBBB05]|nr:hypothetical protein [Pantanalinema sp. GBBB05]
MLRGANLTGAKLDGDDLLGQC